MEKSYADKFEKIRFKNNDEIEKQPQWEIIGAKVLGKEIGSVRWPIICGKQSHSKKKLKKTACSENQMNKKQMWGT